MRAFLTTLVLVSSLSGCIGSESSEPPIVGIRNMYNQPRYDTQERQPFFDDQRSMRPQVAGTVSQEAPLDYFVATGRDARTGVWLDSVHDHSLKGFGDRAAAMVRGKERYDIYCAPCHSRSGDGKGMVSRRAASLGATGLVAPSFHDDRLRHIPDGQLYATISNGVRNMPSYAHNLSVQDRWAIVLYVRALQLSQLEENTEQSQ